MSNEANIALKEVTIKPGKKCIETVELNYPVHLNLPYFQMYI